MSHLHDALHAMPWWLLLIGGAELVLASMDNELRNAAYWSRRPPIVQAIDNLGSWIALAARIFLAVAYFWPTT